MTSFRIFSLKKSIALALKNPIAFCCLNLGGLNSSISGKNKNGKIINLQEYKMSNYKSVQRIDCVQENLIFP